MTARQPLTPRPIVQDAVRRIQDLLTDTLGGELLGDARQQLESILHSLTAAETAPVGAQYSQREVTILLADLRGFAAIAQAFPAKVLLESLNRCIGKLTEIIVQHYGTIENFMGDALMVVFSGDQRAPRDHARRALLCAVQMQIAMDELRRTQGGENLPQLFLGIGINTGRVLAGLIGSELYRAHAVIGEEVNLASRIENYSLRGQILVSESTYELCKDFALCGDPVQVYVKGRSQGVTIREVKSIPGLGKVVPRQEMRRSARVDVMLPFRYQHVERKTVLPEVFKGTLQDLGYEGALAEIDRALPLYSEVKLSVDFPALGYRADDIYGRVVTLRGEGDCFLAGIEFTSLGQESEQRIRQFVQLLLPRYIPVRR